MDFAFLSGWRGLREYDFMTREKYMNLHQCQYISFDGPQPHPLVYISSSAASTLRRQSSVVATCIVQSAAVG